jgi:hypothetical protein
LLGAGGFAHITSVILPLIGPLVAVALAGRDAFERRHALTALILNVGLLAVSLLIAALSGDRDWALGVQALVVAVLIAEQSATSGASSGMSHHLRAGRGAAAGAVLECRSS